MSGHSSPSTPRVLDAGRGDQAAVQQMKLVGAVLVEPDASGVVDREANPAPPPEPVRRHPAPPRPRRCDRRRRARRSCSATRSAFSVRCAGSATCCQSQPPQRPGPAWGQGGCTRSGEASMISTASARRYDFVSSVIAARTRSPGNAWRTKTTRPSSALATQPPPAAIGPASSSITVEQSTHVDAAGLRLMLGGSIRVSPLSQGGSRYLRP